MSGAYCVTLVWFLEVETATPPLDLYLNQRVTDFKRQLEYSRKGDLVHSVCTGVTAYL